MNNINFPCYYYSHYTPYIATASQNVTLIKFLNVILGAFINAANKDESVKKIPMLLLKH